ncbi:MAG: glutaredoxin family protein [Candidatus Thermoplasmatota archaeon]|nr:glutaredoxin family protein [Candidatus Thermoplasmatota archaeon]
MDEFTHVSGKEKADIQLFALSTCVWCRRTRKLLDDLGVSYDYVYVDLLEAERKEAIVKQLERWNPDCSFPTIVLNGKDCIIGFKEERIREALE